MGIHSEECVKYILEFEEDDFLRWIYDNWDEEKAEAFENLYRSEGLSRKLLEYKNELKESGQVFASAVLARLLEES